MFSSLTIFYGIELEIESISYINIEPRTFVPGHSQCQGSRPYFRGHFPLESVVSSWSFGGSYFAPSRLGI